jgi:hypothetical protein
MAATCSRVSAATTNTAMAGPCRLRLAKASATNPSPSEMGSAVEPMMPNASGTAAR